MLLFRLHALLVRTCIEVEANCKAILVENGYIRARGDLTMADYKRINSSHHMDQYKVRLPYWHGDSHTRNAVCDLARRCFFTLVSSVQRLSKHDRHHSFTKATFHNLIDLVCGLVAILSAQFHREDFGPGYDLLALEGPTDSFDVAIGDYFEVEFPNDWRSDEQYTFSDADWRSMKSQADPFQNLFS